MNQMKVSIAELLELSAPERIQLVEDLWDSLAAYPEAIHLTKQQREELDKRLKAYRAAPRQASPWNRVKARIRKRK